MGKHSNEDPSRYPVMYYQVRQLTADWKKKMADLNEVVAELNTVLSLAESTIRDQQQVITDLESNHTDVNSNVSDTADQMLARMAQTRELIKSLSSQPASDTNTNVVTPDDVTPVQVESSDSGTVTDQADSTPASPQEFHAEFDRSGNQ